MTTKANRWLLPDGVDELLPPQANQMEQLRREILDLYRGWGYELIKTPLIEFLDSLMIVPSVKLQLSTFKLVDQLSGKTMGVRADISAQAARIDAHVLQHDTITRLCYTDNVLRTRPQGPLGSRCPQLIGAELYGHGGIESDIEVIGLLLRTLRLAGIVQPLLALGHNQICQLLLEAAWLPDEAEERLFAALQNKATTDLDQELRNSELPPELATVFRLLPTLHGDMSVLARARAAFAPLPESLRNSLEAVISQLDAIATELQDAFPDQALYFDLCERRGYDYHTGIIFSAYVSGHGDAIANGGRYDGIGAAFGRSRPATGFDTDLKTLLQLGQRHFANCERIYAPATQDAALHALAERLRGEGKAVIQGYDTDPASARAQGCGAMLRRNAGGTWVVEPLN